VRLWGVITPPRAARLLLLLPIAACSSAPSPAQTEGCQRLVSAIGFAAPALPDAEPTAPLPEDVRGHVAYVEGTVVRFADELPQAVADDADRLREAAAVLTPADVPVDELAPRLAAYAEAVDAVLADCDG
jgi:hypothetical protein